MTIKVASATAAGPLIRGGPLTARGPLLKGRLIAHSPSLYLASKRVVVGIDGSISTYYDFKRKARRAVERPAMIGWRKAA
jgi:hypothetical protein